MQVEDGAVFFDDWILQGAATSDVFERPSMDVFQLSAHEQEYVNALHYGRQFMELRDAGYIFFIVDPRVRADGQIKAIEKRLSEIQELTRKHSEEGKGRRNATFPYSPEALLRVLDAYEQENIPTAKRGTKTRVAMEIFRPQHSKEWHKRFDDAYRRAVEAAAQPRP